MAKQYKNQAKRRRKFSKRKNGNFVSPKTVKQQYKNPKRELNKYEKQFIEIHGRELYNKLRSARPELRKRPAQFKLMIRAGELFGLDYYRLLIEGDD